jgi:preprotein translocase subunit SecF
MTTAALPPESPALPEHRGFFRRLYYGETKFDFVRPRRWWFAVSGLVILAGVVSLATRGLNFSIDFVGGTGWEVAAPGVTVAQARAALTPLGLGGATITVLGGRTLDVEAKLAHGAKAVQSNAEVARVTAALARLAHKPPSAVTVEQVGPTWGGQITHKAVAALIVFLVLIALYISVFFEWRMALAALVAVVHDVLVTVGIYSLSGFLVTPDTVVAFLTILGYSLYDTIVVFDRVRDNAKGLGATGRLTFTDVVNLSMNQTLARSINTSLVAIMPILAVLVLGADVLGATTLQYFGLALLIGLTSGAYSSLFIASPLVAMLKEREPRYVTIRQRLEARGGALQLLTPAAVAAGALGTAEDGTARGRRVPATKAGRAGAGSRAPAKGRAGAAGSLSAAPGRDAGAAALRLRPGRSPEAAPEEEASDASPGTESVAEDDGQDGLVASAAQGAARTPRRAPAPAAARAGGGARPAGAARRPTPSRTRKKGKRR